MFSPFIGRTSQVKSTLIENSITKPDYKINKELSHNGQKVVCKYVQIWLVLVVCNVVWGNFAIKTDIKKSAEICGNLGSQLLNSFERHTD